LSHDARCCEGVFHICLESKNGEIDSAKYQAERFFGADIPFPD
jgi:hypothetical protein